MRVSLVALLFVGCHTRGNEPAPQQASPSATVSAAVSTSAVASTGAPPVAGPLVIADKDVRDDAGITVVRLEGGKIAVGFAVGTSAVPKVAILDEEGRPTFPDVDARRFFADPIPDGYTRRVLRVTPLGFEADQKTMRIGLDYEDRKVWNHINTGDTLQVREPVRCGPADAPLFAASADPDAGHVTTDVTDCRSFGDAQHPFVLASFSDYHPDSITYTWRAVQPASQTALDSYVFKMGGSDYYCGQKFGYREGPRPCLSTSERPYELPVILQTSAGMVLAARQDHTLVVVKTTTAFAKTDVARFDYAYKEAPDTFKMPTMAALANQEDTVALFFAAHESDDVYASTFRVSEPPRKPAKLELENHRPWLGGGLWSLSASYAPSGEIFLAFIQGSEDDERWGSGGSNIPGYRSARMTVLGPDLHSVVPVFAIDEDTTSTEVRVVALRGDKALLVYRTGGHGFKQRPTQPSQLKTLVVHVPPH